MIVRCLLLAVEAARVQSVLSAPQLLKARAPRPLAEAARRLDCGFTWRSLPQDRPYGAQWSVAPPGPAAFWDRRGLGFWALRCFFGGRPAVAADPPRTRAAAPAANEPRRRGAGGPLGLRSRPGAGGRSRQCPQLPGRARLPAALRRVDSERPAVAMPLFTGPCTMRRGLTFDVSWNVRIISLLETLSAANCGIICH